MGIHQYTPPGNHINILLSFKFVLFNFLLLYFTLLVFLYFFVYVVSMHVSMDVWVCVYTCVAIYRHVCGGVEVDIMYFS